MEAAGSAAASSRLAEVEPAGLMETACAGLWLRWHARSGPMPSGSRPWMPTWLPGRRARPRAGEGGCRGCHP